MSSTGDSTRVLLTLDLDFLELIDQWTAIKFKNRSEFMRDGIRHYINYLDAQAKTG